MKSLDIPTENKLLIKKFKKRNKSFVHGFLETNIADGTLTAEVHHMNSTTVILRLKKSNGEVFTRTAKTEQNFSTLHDLALELLRLRKSNAMINVIESKICADRRVMDYKIRHDRRRILRIGDLERLRTSVLPVLLSDQAIENFLEVFRGKDLAIFDTTYSRYYNSSFPNEILFGQRLSNGQIYDVSFLQHGASVRKKNSLLAHSYEGSVATVENSKGESITLALTATNVIFCGLTKEFGKIVITFDKTDENIPDVNISKFQTAVNILKNFDITPELEVLNYVRANDTIIPEFQTPEMIDLIKKLLEVVIE